MTGMEGSVLTGIPSLICRDNVLCYFRGETVMDQVHQRFDILHREAPKALLALLYQVRDIGEFIVTQAADAPDKIVAVLGKMVGNRGQDRMEHMPGAGAGQVPAFRREFLQYRNILLIEFAWHGGSTRIIILRALE